MKINLSEKISEHLSRLESLAIEADGDEDQSYSSRASAMSALSSILVTLTKSQESIQNMDKLQKIEKVTIETCQKYLTVDQCEAFLQELETLLGVELDET